MSCSNCCGTQDCLVMKQTLILIPFCTTVRLDNLNFLLRFISKFHYDFDTNAMPPNCESFSFYPQKDFLCNNLLIKIVQNRTLNSLEVNKQIARICLKPSQQVMFFFLPIYLSIYLFFHIYKYFHQSIDLSIYLSFYLSMYIYIYTYIYIHISYLEKVGILATGCRRFGTKNDAKGQRTT